MVLIVEPDGLIAARDALGYHPLFVAEQDGCVLMAPSQELLFAAGVPAEVNRAVVAGWLSRQSVDGRETFFSTVRRLVPGHCLRVSPKGVSEHRYWNPATTRRADEVSFESRARRVRENPAPFCRSVPRPRPGRHPAQRRDRLGGCRGSRDGGKS